MGSERTQRVSPDVDIKEKDLLGLDEALGDGFGELEWPELQGKKQRENTARGEEEDDSGDSAEEGQQAKPIRATREP